MRVPALAALLASAGWAASCSGEGPVPTRIVLITLDTLRADGLEDMPEILARGESGVVFERAYAATSTTQPTHASLFTGLHPWQHGVTRNGQVLGEAHMTVAERLRGEGFETVGIAASFPMERRFGFAQGFARYHDEFVEPYVRVWEGEELEGGRFHSLHEAVTERALAELERSRSPRQFLWVHYFDPHDPYGDAAEGPKGRVMEIGTLLKAAAQGDPRAPQIVSRAKERYDADVAALDRSLARLIEGIEADAERYRTHVFVTSDHGESFGELGCLGHGKRLVPAQVHVPLVYLGAAAPAGKRADACGSVDVAATVLALAGVDFGMTEGRDLFADVPGGAFALGMRRSFVEARHEQLLDGRRLPIEGERFFLARDTELLAGDGTSLFHDDDPARRAEGPGTEEVRVLFTALRQKLAGVESEELLDAEVQDALGALGYGR